MGTYTLKYRTFDSLVADASSDFKKYQLQNLIDPQDLIKVARRCTYSLGLRINQTKERILEVEKGRVRFPNDFYILNFALMTGDYETKAYLPQGTWTEEKVIGTLAPEYQQAPPEEIDLCTMTTPTIEPVCPQCGCAEQHGYCKTCCTNPESCTLNCKGEVVQLVQRLTTQTRYFRQLAPLKILYATEDLNDLCPNLYWESPYSATIRDGWLHTSFQTGKVYINYQGHLEDADGQLLVPDHPILNEYYEYALKQRIIENLLMNDEEVNVNKIQLIESRYKDARINAESLVNTPDFTELKELFKMNKNAMYSKYYDMFASSARLNIR